LAVKQILIKIKQKFGPETKLKFYLLAATLGWIFID